MVLTIIVADRVVNDRDKSIVPRITGLKSML